MGRRQVPVQKELAAEPEESPSLPALQQVNINHQSMAYDDLVFTFIIYLFFCLLMTLTMTDFNLIDGVTVLTVLLFLSFLCHVRGRRTLGNRAGRGATLLAHAVLVSLGHGLTELHSTFSGPSLG